MTSPQTIYFAGDLFDHKDLSGNALLAEAINTVSQGRYQCILPQNLEQSANRAEEIRNNDLKQVLECDLALFNFDGTELDSGTVVEYMYAKFLDKPSVIIRSDFRVAGDQQDGDPWNLMCSFYPRTEIIGVNAMAEYQRAMKGAETVSEKLKLYHSRIAEKIVEAFDQVCLQPSTMEQAGIDPAQIIQWAKALPGKGFQQLCK